MSGAGKIDRDKLSLIHVARAALRMNEDDYRGLLQRVAGVESSKDLDSAGFDAVMTEYSRLGFESTAARERRLEPERAPGHATSAQRSTILKLWNEYKGRKDYEGLRRWLDHHFGVSELRFLSRDKAGRVIAALRNFKPKIAPSTEPEPQ